MRQQRPALLMLPLALFSLAGCSGTPFGEQLSRSFSQAPASPPSASRPVPAATGSGPSSSKPGGKVASQAAAVAPGKPPAAAPKAQATAPARQPVAPAAPLTPAPYRVTIKLPAADPSSPAEAVTDALRAAGVAFEVETIERVPAGADLPAAPLRSTAPAPR
ncbi:MAG: hypothetical protein ACKOAP_03555 [Vulcanococcus sp.]